MAANGRLRPEELSPIPGGKLAHAAAQAWNAPGGPADNGCRPGGPESSYRTYAGQVKQREYWCERGECWNAAEPGHSNHGEGICVDEPSPQKQQWLLHEGPRFGWQKDEAMDEPWHFTWRSGTADRGALTLRRGEKGYWVRRYRNRLKRLGYRMPGNTRGFGPLMERRVKKFQKHHKIKQTGIIDGRTAYLINAELRRKKR